MITSIERIHLGAESDTKVSLYRAEGEHYLVRHSPFGFARLTEEYARALIALCGHNGEGSEIKTEVSGALRSFIDHHRQEPAKHRRLRRLNLLVSQKCNSRCRYCYAGQGNYGADRLMSSDVVRKAIQGALQHFERVENIQFFGGEPLLAWQLIGEAVSYAEALAGELQKPVPQFTVITNLTFLPADILALVQARKLNVITSLDGPKHIHDRNRRLASGQPTYDAVVANIRKLVPYSQPRTIEATYTSAHKDSGIRPLDIEQHIRSICPDANVVVVPDLNLPFEAEEAIFHFDLTSYCAGDARWDDPRIDKLLARYTGLVANGARGDIFCDLGVSNFTVDAQGGVWPCHILCNKGEPLGTVSDDWAAIARRFDSGLGKELKKSRFPECRTCFLRDYCTSCPVAWKRSGAMAPIPAQCERDRAAYLTAFRLTLERQKAAGS